MYKYVVNGNKVIAISTYAGKTVKGVAKCDPRDPFNEEKGVKLSTARCNEKVAKKRMRRAETKVEEAERMLDRANAHYYKMLNYLSDAEDAYRDAITQVADIEETL